MRRLLGWARDKGWNQTQLAERLGVTPAHITNWKSRGLPADRYLDVANLFGKSLDEVAGLSEERNVSAGPTVTGLIPILSTVQAGMYKEIYEFHLSEVETTPTTAPIRRYTFALRVEGDSMEPTFPEGYIVIVEPDEEARPGDFVVARNGDNEATFKQLIKDGGEFFLKPLNPRYPIRPLGDSVIVGVVIGAHIVFRR